MKEKQLGLMLGIIGVVILILFVSIIPTMQNAGQAACACDGVCPHADRLPFQFYLGVGVALVMFYMSYRTIIGDKPKKKEIVEIPKNLDSDEKAVIDKLVEADGMTFQSELVTKLDWSKVKVTRILDKLESRKLIERRRRGMTNAVILKGKE